MAGREGVLIGVQLVVHPPADDQPDERRNDQINQPHFMHRATPLVIVSPLSCGERGGAVNPSPLAQERVTLRFALENGSGLAGLAIGLHSRAKLMKSRTCCTSM